jgi:OHCU decarboxylase
MPRPIFVKRFGGVFEHSPWIADRAYQRLMAGDYDDADRLHALLAGVFRAADRDRRLGVLRAHPDLAGKLAKAGRLTAESTAEQAGAGLDLLTDAERAMFSELNEIYTKRQGFPFIIAVRDHDKAGILAAFHQRLAHDQDTEFEEACRQVERIAWRRLQDMTP